MTPGHVSACMGILGTTVAVTVFLSGSPNFETILMRFRAPSQATLDHVAQAQRRLLADLDQVCASRNLRPLFERMPCATIHTTDAHVNDSAPVGRDAAQLVRAHSVQVGSAISRFVSAVEFNGNRVGRQGVAAYRDWDAQRAREVEQLLAKPNLTWGELNRARERQMSALRARIKDTFS